MDYVTFYHVAAVADVSRIKLGINPGSNDWAQYDMGFYTFLNRDDAAKWQGHRLEDPTVILELRLPREVWDRMRERTVPQEFDWSIPAEWLEDYEVLWGPWAETDDTEDMAGAWQVKFNPHTYHQLDEVRVCPAEEVQA